MRYSRIWMPCVAILGLAVGTAIAQEKTAKGKKESPQELTSKPQKIQKATTVDFPAQLGLPFQSLADLGTRIEKARTAADPVELATIAKLLSAAERVSGKKASITSKGLSDEAVELCKRRKFSLELATVALLVDDDTAKELQKLAAQCQREEKERLAALESGEKTRDIHGDLVVDNHSHEYLRIYVNGRYVGGVPPHGHRHFHVHHASHLEARSRYHYWHRDVYGHRHGYRWVIHGHHHH